MAQKIRPKSQAPRPGQSSEEYWRERETRQRAENIKNEASIAERINKIFRTAQDNIEQEIDSFYRRYAAKEGIDIIEARKRVSQIDMEKYERLAQQYVKAAHSGGREEAFSDEANEQMRLYNATMRINRLEMLKARCGIRVMEGYRLTQELINDNLEERVYSEYYRLAGILGNTVQFNENLVRSIVDASYQNATWSQRLWNNQAVLSAQIGAQLVQGILTGKSSTVLARNIQKLTGAGTYECQRLMRTELRRVQTAAAERSMLDNGVDEYKYLVANGVNPCEECLALDGMVFKISEMTVGRNAPPKHPFCHCCTCPHVDEAKWQRWLDGPAQEGVPWKEFDDGKGNDNSMFSRSSTSTKSSKRRSQKQLEKVATDIRGKMRSYVKNESKWSGRIRVVNRMELVDGMMPLGAKRANCDISLFPDSSDATIWHEMLHSASVSHYKKTGNILYGKMEEASVSMLTREICKKEGISARTDYKHFVDVLDNVSSYLGYDKFDFAVDLFNTPLPERLEWLRGKLSDKMKEDNLNFEEQGDGIIYLNKLSGGINVKNR